MSDYSEEQLESQNWFNYEDFYDTIAAREDFTYFVEVGCWKGHSLRHLARRLSERGGDFEIYGVDLWRADYLREYDPQSYRDAETLYEIYCANLENAGVRELVKDIRGNSWESAAQFEDGSLDFVYIDADHTYESVVKDINAWLPKVRRGGIISGHDYFTYPSVRKAVDEAFGAAVQSIAPVWFIEKAMPQVSRNPPATENMSRHAGPRPFRSRAERHRVSSRMIRRKRRIQVANSSVWRFPDVIDPFAERAGRVIRSLHKRANKTIPIFERLASRRIWVDVIILVYDEYEYLVEALESLLEQTCGAFRVTLVDNGSTRPETLSLLDHLRSIDTDLIQVISPGRRVGVVAARNLGVSRTEYPYILMFDADDKLDRTCIEVMLHALQSEPLLGAAYCSWRLFGEQSGVVEAQDYNLASLLKQNYMTVTSMCRRELFDLVGGYSAEMEDGYEDWEFWIKLAEAGWFARKVPGVLLNVRMKPASRNISASRNAGKLVDRIRRLHPGSYNPAHRARIVQTWDNGGPYDPAPAPNFAPLPQQPLVSVIIPCYKYGGYVRQTLESVLDQTYDKIEIIICDDGSPDDYTQEVLSSIQDERVRVFRQPNQGLAQSRNNAIGMASGELILPLDADDIILPEMIERCVATILENPSVGFVYTDILFFDEQHGLHLHRPYNFYLELCDNQATVCAMFRKEAWRRAGGYHPNMREGMEDWNFWVSLGRIHCMGQLIPEPLFAYRLHGTSMSTETSKHRNRLISRIRTNHPTLYLPKSIDSIHQQWAPRIPEDRPRRRPDLPTEDPPFVRAVDSTCMFSIIIPSFGHAKYLDRCLSSVFHQSDPDYELIVVEDAYGDPGIDRRLRRLADERGNVTLVFNPSNQGISRTLNRGIKHARGEYICMLDCDDELTANALERLRVQIEEGSRKHFISTQRINIDETGEVLGVVERDEAPADLLHGNHAGHLRAVQRNVFIELGGFNPLYDGCQDYEHVLRVQESRPITYLNEPLYRYRWHAATQSVSAATQQRDQSTRVQRFAQFRQFLHDRTVRKGRLFGLIVVASDPNQAIDPKIASHFNVEHVRLDLDVDLQGVSLPKDVRTTVSKMLASSELSGRFVLFAGGGLWLSEVTIIAMLCRLLSVPRAASVTGRFVDAAGKDQVGAFTGDLVVSEDNLDMPAPWEYLRLHRPFRWTGVVFERSSLRDMLATDDPKLPLPGAADGHLYSPDARIVVAPNCPLNRRTPILTDINVVPTQVPDDTPSRRATAAASD